MTQIPLSRRQTLRGIALAGAAGAGATLPALLRAQSAPEVIKVGWAISKSGAFAGGAGASQIPNYQLWVEDVNKAGGLKLGGRQVPLQVVEYDDRSQSEEAVRAVERLISQDKVDLLLPPWGTGMNMAVAPAFQRGNFPMIAPSFITDRMPELVKRWKNVFSLLQTASTYAEGIVGVLKDLRSAGRIGSNVAMVHVTDQFGLELATAARKALQAGGFKLVQDAGYPISTQDLTPVVAEAQRANPDVFLAFSYPPDTIGLTETARVRGFNPKVFYTGVGSALPLYPGKFGAAIEGVMGPGGWAPDSDRLKAYIKSHQERLGRPSDQGVSSLCYAGLQALAQAAEKVGKIDRPAIVAALAAGTFDTIIGPLRFENNILAGGWTVGQWQGGTFRGVAPKQDGVKPVIAKPAWKVS